MYRLNKILFLIFSMTLALSCNVYTNDDAIKHGEKIIAADKEKLQNIISLCEKLADDSCLIYEISISNVTSSFSFFDYNYSDSEKKYVFDNNLDIQNEKMELVRNNIPKKQITDFIFVKNEFIIFNIDNVRDSQYLGAKLIYCFDKDIFLKIFNCNDFNEDVDKKKLESARWIHFFDKNWAITTTFDVSKMLKKCSN